MVEDLEQYIREYGDAVYRFCCNQTGNRYDAEELYQDTFLCILEHQKKFQKVTNQKCYILGVALNLQRNRRRKRARRNRILPIAPQQMRTGMDELGERPEFADTSGKEMGQEMICQEMKQIMRAEITILPERYRDTLSLFYGNELTVAEIAQILKIPQGTVKTRLYLARKRLKEKLEGEGYDGTEFG